MVQGQALLCRCARRSPECGGPDVLTLAAIVAWPPSASTPVQHHPVCCATGLFQKPTLQDTGDRALHPIVMGAQKRGACGHPLRLQHHTSACAAPCEAGVAGTGKPCARATPP